MSKSRNKKKKGFTPISHHTRQGDVLKTKVSDLPIEMINWERDLIPEHIWIDLLFNNYPHVAWHKIYEEFMDRLDQSLERKLNFPLLGMISDFGIPTEQERKQFIENNKDFIYKYFFLPVGKILSLYPENPANWLILEEWGNKNTINIEQELRKLEESLMRLIKAKDLHAGHIRTLPLSRILKHGIISLPKTGMESFLNPLTRYPGKCSEEEKYTVQQMSRTLLNTYFMSENRYKSKNWPMYFWRHNLNLVSCTPIDSSLDEGDIKDNDSMKDLQKRQWGNCIKLMKYLDKIGIQYKYDLYTPLKDEIKLGLFSRIVRLYISFISNPFFWNRDLSGILLRCLGETTIIFFYFVKKGTDEEYKNFHDYALGKEKLLMLHLQDTLDEQTSLEGKTIDNISKDLGGGFSAEILDIHLKDWTKKNIRDLASAVGLENI